MFRNSNRFSFNKTIHIVKRGQIRISFPKQAKICLKSKFDVHFFETSDIRGVFLPSESNTYEFLNLQVYHHATFTSTILNSLPFPSFQCVFLLGREILFITESVPCRHYVTRNFFMNQHSFI